MYFTNQNIFVQIMFIKSSAVNPWRWGLLKFKQFRNLLVAKIFRLATSVILKLNFHCYQLWKHIAISPARDSFSAFYIHMYVSAYICMHVKKQEKKQYLTVWPKQWYNILSVMNYKQSNIFPFFSSPIFYLSVIHVKIMLEILNSELQLLHQYIKFCY